MCTSDRWGLADPAALIARLEQNPDVLGILQYGSGGWPDGADTDLCVIVPRRPEGLESAHFWLESGPVDLNVRTLEDLERCDVEPGFDEVLREGRVLYEREPGLLAGLSAKHVSEPSPPASEEVVRTRFGHTHYIHKLEHYRQRDPLLCNVILCGAVHWLLRAYVSVRGFDYRSEKPALEAMGQDDPSMLADLGAASGSAPLDERIEAIRRLTEKVLEPVGGPWRRDELLFFTAGEAKPEARSGWERFVTSLIGQLE